MSLPVLNGEEHRVLEDILARFDKNNDGIVSLDEIVAEFDTIGDQGTANLLKDLMLADWDADKNQTLTTDELRAMAVKWSSYPGDQSIPR